MYTKIQPKIPNDHKILQIFPTSRPSKIFKNWNFGMKIYHLATLLLNTKQTNQSTKRDRETDIETDRQTER
jgi:predicted alpha-1,6-mannanase (GH76 family)